MSDISELMTLGIELVNAHVNLQEVMKDRPTDRAVLLKVCRPHPEVEALFPNWLKLHVDKKLTDRAVVEEVFNIWLDTEEWQVKYTVGPKTLAAPAVVAYLPEWLFQLIAARVETLWSAFITGKPMWVLSTGGSEFDLRDLMQIDTILGMVNEALLTRGINLAEVVR